MLGSDQSVRCYESDISSIIRVADEQKHSETFWTLSIIPPALLINGLLEESSLLKKTLWGILCSKEDCSIHRWVWWFTVHLRMTAVLILSPETCSQEYFLLWNMKDMRIFCVPQKKVSHTALKDVREMEWWQNTQHSHRLMSNSLLNQYVFMYYFMRYILERNFLSNWKLLTKMILFCQS